MKATIISFFTFVILLASTFFLSEKLEINKKVTYQQQQIEQLSFSLKQKNNEIDSLYFANEEKISIINQQLKKNSIMVNVSIYHANEKECDSTPLITADLTNIDARKIKSSRIISVSRNLLTNNGGFLKFGDRVMLVNAGQLTGIYIVRDVMHPKYKNKVDVLVDNHVNNLFFNNSALIKIIKDEKSVAL